MSRAVAGSQYTVVKHDWLSTIAAEAYGDMFKWPLIADANPQINGRGVAIDGSSLIFGGDVLWIPSEEVAEQDSPTFGEQQENDFSVAIEGELLPITKGSLLLTMDSGSDELKVDVDIESLTPTMRKMLLPFQYPKVTVRINGVLKMSGVIYVTEPKSSKDGKVKTLYGYSYTADLIDSVVNAPYEQNGVTLLDRAETLTKDMGITAVFYSGAKEQFDKVTAKNGEKRFSHLVKLAKERGLLVSCTAYGNLLFHRAAISGAPVDVIEEGDFGGISFGAKYDGRKRFSSYRVTGKAISGDGVTTTVVDPFVSRARFFSRKERNADSGGAEKAAIWERSKAVADALTMACPVDGFTTKKGELWTTNTYVTVKSSSIDLKNGADLLIRRVRFNYSPTSKNATIDVVPSEVFSNEEIPNIWS